MLSLKTDLPEDRIQVSGNVTTPQNYQVYWRSGPRTNVRYCTPGFPLLSSRSQVRTQELYVRTISQLCFLIVHPIMSMQI